MPTFGLTPYGSATPAGTQRITMHAILLNGNGKHWRSYFYRSIGPYKIAHWVRKHGYTCQVIDQADRFTRDQMLALITRFITKETKVIGLSSTFLCREQVMHGDGRIRKIPEDLYLALHDVKKQHPGIRFVMGGYMSDCLGGGWNGLIDATVMSYRKATEDIFLEYLEHLVKGSEPPIGDPFTPLFGGSKRMIYREARNPRYDIEKDDFRWTKQDVILPGEALPLDVSRGCIFTCKFCQFPHLGKKKMDYIRGMDRISEELHYNKETFGTTRYFIVDDTFNDSPTKMEEFHRMSSNLGFGIEYAAYLRADLIHRYPDTAHMLSESGLFGAFHGIETLHPESARMIGKGWSGTHARDYIPRLFHDVWKRNIAQHMAFIVGFPEETLDHVTSTARWFIENNLHSMGFNGLGLYGTSKHTGWEHTSEFDRNAEKYGFEWLDVSPDGVGFRKWRNKNWTNETASQTADRLNLELDDHIRMQMWVSVILLGYGYDRRFLIDTLNRDLPWDEIKSKTAENIENYRLGLMSI